jgi:hypothetical protein
LVVKVLAAASTFTTFFSSSRRVANKAALLKNSAARSAEHYNLNQMKQPLGIRILSWFAALASGGMFVSIALAVLDIGPHLMGGEKVTRSEWLHIAAPLVAVIGCLMASIAYGLAARKAWARHLVMAIFVLIIVYAAARSAHSMCFGARLCGVPSLTPLCLVVRVRGTSTSNQTSLSIFGNSEGNSAGQRRNISRCFLLRY